jgi:putative transcriptional regulator
LIVTFLVATLYTNSFTNTALAEPGSPKPQVSQGVFLVATEKLHGSSFQKTIILLTHFSNREVMGLAINRPTDIPLNQVFPDISQLKNNTGLLYMGGPVRPKTLFVLLKTKRPKEGMHHVIDDVYFSSAKNAFSPPLQKITRAYNGYSGWSKRQLQNEIKRGDWLIVHADPAIIFEENTSTLWQRLFKKWSGSWT